MRKVQHKKYKSFYVELRRSHKGYGCEYYKPLELDGIGITKIYIGEHEKSPRFHIIDPSTRKYITTISLIKPEYIGTKSLRLNDRQKEQLIKWLMEDSIWNKINPPEYMIQSMYNEWMCFYLSEKELLEAVVPVHPGPIPDYSLLK